MLEKFYSDKATTEQFKSTLSLYRFYKSIFGVSCLLMEMQTKRDIGKERFDGFPKLKYKYLLVIVIRVGFLVFSEHFWKRCPL